MLNVMYFNSKPRISCKPLILVIYFIINYGQKSMLSHHVKCGWLYVCILLHEAVATPHHHYSYSAHTHSSNFSTYLPEVWQIDREHPSKNRFTEPYQNMVFETFSSRKAEFLMDFRQILYWHPFWNTALSVNIKAQRSRSQGRVCEFCAHFCFKSL